MTDRDDRPAPSSTSARPARTAQNVTDRPNFQPPTPADHALAEARATIVGLERTLAATQAHLDDVRRERDHLAAALHPRLVLPTDPNPLDVGEAFGRVTGGALWATTQRPPHPGDEPVEDPLADLRDARLVRDQMGTVWRRVLDGEAPTDWWRPANRYPEPAHRLEWMASEWGPLTREEVVRRNHLPQD